MHNKYVSERFVLMGFAENLKKYRKKKKLTQKALAQLLHISFRTIQSYESGAVLPKDKKRYEDICTVLEISYEDLLLGETEIPMIRVPDKDSDENPYQLVGKISGLFFSNDFPDEDKEAVMKAIIDSYRQFKDSKKDEK